MRVGSKVMLYIDDTLGGHNLFAAAVWQRNGQTVDLERLGFSLSAKGELRPFPLQKSLGMLIHLGQPTTSWHLPQDKLEAVREVAGELLHGASRSEQVACQLVAKCIGKLISAARAVPIGRLLFRELNTAIYAKGTPPWDGYAELVGRAIIDLRYIVECM